MTKDTNPKDLRSAQTPSAGKFSPLDEELYDNAQDVSRRDFLALGGLAATVGGLGASPSAKAHTLDEDEPVKIGYLPILDATALLVAHGMNFFEDEGLKTEPPTLIRGWSPLVESFAARKFNLVHLLKPIPVWMRYNNRIPVKIMAWAHTNGSGLVVGKDSGVDSFADLGGKQIAVPYWYSMHNIVLQMALRAYDLVPVIKPKTATLQENECNLQVLPPPEMPIALAGRKIDGYIVAEPFNALGELKVQARMLRFTGDIWRNHPCCVITMHEDVTEERPSWTQKVMNAVVRAEIYASNHKAEVAHLISKDGKGYLPVPSEVAVKAMTDYGTDYEDTGAIQNRAWQTGRIDFQPWPYPSATYVIVESMSRTLVGGDKTFLDDLDPGFVTQDLVDYKFVARAMLKYPQWKDDPSVSKSQDPFVREELFSISKGGF